MPSDAITVAIKDSVDSSCCIVAASSAPLGARPPQTEEPRQDGNGINSKEEDDKKNSKKEEEEKEEEEEGARVLFRDEEEFRRKRERIMADGTDQLQVIAGQVRCGGWCVFGRTVSEWWGAWTVEWVVIMTVICWRT